MTDTASADLAALRRLLGPELLEALEYWEETAGLGADDVARRLSDRWQQALAAAAGVAS